MAEASQEPTIFVKPGQTTTVQVPLSYTELTAWTGPYESSKGETEKKLLGPVKITNKSCESAEEPNNSYGRVITHEQKETLTEGRLENPFQPFGSFALCLVDKNTKKTYTVNYTNSTVEGSKPQIYIGQKTKSEREKENAEAKTAKEKREKEETEAKTAKEKREKEETTMATAKTTREATEKAKREKWKKEETEGKISKATREKRETEQTEERVKIEAEEKAAKEKREKEETEAKTAKEQREKEETEAKAAETTRKAEEAEEAKNGVTVESGEKC